MYFRAIDIQHTGCVSESGDFATVFFLVQQQLDGCRCRHFAAKFNPYRTNVENRMSS